MKAKLYILLSSLLIAACITSSAQEIIGTFSSTSNSYDCDIAEATDGSIIIGSYVGDRDYMVYKLSPEGILIDSISLPGTETYYFSQLSGIPHMPDHYTIAFYSSDSGDEGILLKFKFILIDDNFMVVNETDEIIEMGGIAYSVSVNSDCWFATPNKNIIFSYNYEDLTKGACVQHFIRFNFDGTFLEDVALTEIPDGGGMDVPTCDSVLNYTGFKVFSESPLTYSCLGGYTNNDTIHFANCIIDSDYHLIERIEYAPIAPDITFSYEWWADIIPFEQPEAISHLMATDLTLANRRMPAIIKYNGDGSPIASYLFSDASNAFSGKTIVKDENTIYYSYFYNRFGVSQYLIRMDGNLGSTWNLPLPCPNNQQNGILSMKVLQNGDIAVGTIRYITQSNSILEVFIIRDGYDSTHENPTAESPFTLYPNPVKDLLGLSFVEDIEPENVELFDLSGHGGGTKCNNMESIDMSGMPAGVYILRVTMKDGTSYHEKILKE